METQNKRISRIVSYLDALGIKNINIEKDYDSRVKVQKIAFIMDTLVGELKFDDFRFRIKGPYSHMLTEEYFAHHGAFNSKPTYELDDRERVQIEKIREVMANHLDAESLEIVASLLFLKEKEHFGYEEAELELIKRKPHLSEEAIWQGGNLLKALLLTDERRKAIMKSLQKEMEEWDDASNDNLRRFGQ